MAEYVLIMLINKKQPGMNTFKLLIYKVLVILEAIFRLATWGRLPR
jgi:hypothetical protein